MAAKFKCSERTVYWNAEFRKFESTLQSKVTLLEGKGFWVGIISENTTFHGSETDFWGREKNVRRKKESEDTKATAPQQKQQQQDHWF